MRRGAVFVTFSAETEKSLRRWIVAKGLSTFQPSVRADLAKLLGSAEAVELIEAVCAIEGFADLEHHRAIRRAVLKSLRRDGVSLGRGKKPRPEMVLLVECVVPIAMAYGVPLRIGETSKMVELLRCVAADGLGMKGDPRRELRRQVRGHSGSVRILLPRLPPPTRAAVIAAVRAGLEPLRPRVR